MTATPWTSRIVGHGRIDPRDLTAHPLNHRTHPEAQRRALAAAIDEVGFVRSVTVNRTTGRIIDGHARVELAIADGIPEIDVEFVELTPEQELLALASFDAIGELAEADAAVLADLLRAVEAESDELAALLDGMAEDAGIDLSTAEPAAPQKTVEINFPEFDESLDHDYRCPKCRYLWSGLPK